MRVRPEGASPRASQPPACYHGFRSRIGQRVLLKRPMLQSRRIPYLVLFGLLGIVLGGLYWTATPRRPDLRPAKPEEWTPTQTLEAFIQAQESGEVEAVRDLLVKEARAEFDEMSARMSRDDLIATGLRFEQERYRLEETKTDTATFYAASSALYLVMVREENRWRLDPKRTDRVNREQR